MQFSNQFQDLLSNLGQIYNTFQWIVYSNVPTDIQWMVDQCQICVSSFSPVTITHM